MKIYIKWKPKWTAGDKIKVCQHNSGVHQENLISGTFCNDCGYLVAFTQSAWETPKFVFDRKKEPVILELNEIEINQVLKAIHRKPINSNPKSK